MTHVILIFTLLQWNQTHDIFEVCLDPRNHENLHFSKDMWKHLLRAVSPLHIERLGGDALSGPSVRDVRVFWVCISTSRHLPGPSPVQGRSNSQDSEKQNQWDI